MDTSGSVRVGDVSGGILPWDHTIVPYLAHRAPTYQHISGVSPRSPRYWSSPSLILNFLFLWNQFLPTGHRSHNSQNFCELILVFLWPYLVKEILLFSGHLFTSKLFHKSNVWNITRIASAVWCHYWSGHKDCHEFRFSIVRSVISVSKVKSL